MEWMKKRYGRHGKKSKEHSPSDSGSDSESDSAQLGEVETAEDNGWDAIKTHKGKKQNKLEDEKRKLQARLEQIELQEEKERKKQMRNGKTRKEEENKMKEEKRVKMESIKKEERQKDEEIRTGKEKQIDEGTKLEEENGIRKKIEEELRIEEEKRIRKKIEEELRIEEENTIRKRIEEELKAEEENRIRMRIEEEIRVKEENRIKRLQREKREKEENRIRKNIEEEMRRDGVNRTKEHLGIADETWMDKGKRKEEENRIDEEKRIREEKERETRSRIKEQMVMDNEKRIEEERRMEEEIQRQKQMSGCQTQMPEDEARAQAPEDQLLTKAREEVMKMQLKSLALTDFEMLLNSNSDVLNDLVMRLNFSAFERDKVKHYASGGGKPHEKFVDYILRTQIDIDDVIEAAESIGNEEVARILTNIKETKDVTWTTEIEPCDGVQLYLPLAYDPQNPATRRTSWEALSGALDLSHFNRDLQVTREYGGVYSRGDAFLSILEAKGETVEFLSKILAQDFGPDAPPKTALADCFSEAVEKKVAAHKKKLERKNKR